MSDLSAPRLVVLDEPTFVKAHIRSSSTFSTYPRPLARSSNPHADALGVLIHYEQWGLVLGTVQLKFVGDALMSVLGLTAQHVAAYILELRRLAELSNGGIVQPVGDGPLGPGIASEIRRAVHIAEWADVDALVIDGPISAAKSTTADRWVATPRAFADKAPFGPGGRAGP